MSAFDATVDVMFADVNLAAAATFTVDGGTPAPIRVIARRPDRIVEFGDALLASDGTLFDLRVSEVTEPRPGDRLEIVRMGQRRGQPVSAGMLD